MWDRRKRGKYRGIGVDIAWFVFIVLISTKMDHSVLIHYRSIGIS
jgi:hypothetical protein